jgi:DeoR family transcriptional regulator, glycerol-3-phosphate regulon repressor
LAATYKPSVTDTREPSNAVATPSAMAMSGARARELSQRQSGILALLREAGRVSVEELALRYAVTPQTVRRDLNELGEARLVTRVHGGAMIASGVENVAYDARKLVAQTQKRLIGEAAARLIGDNSSLFINIGTTTEEVARALASHNGLLVITNNLHVAVELYRHPHIDVIVCGGAVRRSDGAVLGQSTLEMIRQFRVDVAIIGISAIDEDGSLLDFDIREVQVTQQIIEHARRVVLVADSSKFARTAPVHAAHISHIDVFITDRAPPPSISELCARHGVDLVETGGPEEAEEEAR